jgi:hypothetical protein
VPWLPVIFLMPISIEGLGFERLNISEDYTMTCFEAG